MRETQLIALRPVLDIETEKQFPLELFQSEVLRPILKYQHQILLKIFQNYILNQKIDATKLSREKIAQIIQKNMQVRYSLFGTIIGLFIMEEMDFFIENQDLLQKRLLQMVIERIASSYLILE